LGSGGSLLRSDQGDFKGGLAHVDAHVGIRRRD